MYVLKLVLQCQWLHLLIILVWLVIFIAKCKKWEEIARIYAAIVHRYNRFGPIPKHERN